MSTYWTLANYEVQYSSQILYINGSEDTRTAYTFNTAMYDGAIKRYWIKDVIICHGSNCAVSQPMGR